jgi:thiol-disulfide isomerase/thioredoxin
MKHLKFFLLLTLFWSCDSKDKTEQSWKKNAETILAGKIEPYNPLSSPRKMSFYYYDETLDQITSDIEIDSLGNFTSRFKLNHPQDINFYYRSWLKVILRPGDSLHLTFDGNQAEKNDLYASLKVTGDSKELNEDLHKFLINDSILKTYYYPIAKLGPAEFRTYHDSLFQKRHAYIADFIRSKPDMPEELESWLDFERKILPVERLLEFPMYYRMYNRNKADSISYPDDFFDATKRLNDLSEGSFVNGSIASLGNQLLFYYYEKINPTNKRLDAKVEDSLLFVALKNDFGINRIPMQLALADKIRASLDGMNTRFVDDNLDKLKTIYGSSDLGQAMFKAYKDTKAELAKTELPEEVNFLSFESENPEDYLGEIIEKANGKVVYIDHWATWCAPCRSEFKNALPDFKEKYKDAIEFVYFCYSSKEEEWQPLIRKFQLSGMHYFVNEHEDDILQEQMSVNGYPTYTIINQQGEIVVSDFKYRPSRKETSRVIDSLLKMNESL